MKKLFMLVLFLIILTPVCSFSKTSITGFYSGDKDEGVITAYSDDSNVIHIFMASKKNFYVRYGTGSFASLASGITVSSSNIGDAVLKMSVDNSGTCIGSWETNSSLCGNGALAATKKETNITEDISGAYGFTVGSFDFSVSVHPDGSLLLFGEANGDGVDPIVGTGGINEYGLFAGVASNGSMSFAGKINHGKIDYVWIHSASIGLLDGTASSKIEGCRVYPKSFSYGASNKIPKVGELVSFNIAILSDCYNPEAYFFYSYCPNYGNSYYDASYWVPLRKGDFTTLNKYSGYFSAPGNYVIVAWVSPTPSAPNPIQMIGCTITVDP